MNKLKIKIILASVRQGRFGDKPAKWIYDIAERMEELSPEILDLLNHQLPMFAEAVSPAYTHGVHINAPWNLVEKDGTPKFGVLDTYKDSAENLLTQLTWWARALKNAREE